MSKDKHPLDDALYEAVTGFESRLRQPRTSRHNKSWDTDTNGARSLHAVLTSAQPDGTEKVYDVTVTVTERVDSNDWYWGPEHLGDPAKDAKRVVVGSVHYMLGSGGSQPRGHGGRRFDIEFFDGRRITSHDLWFQGTIPPKWRERYPDNARFLTDNADFGLVSRGLPDQKVIKP